MNRCFRLSADSYEQIRARLDLLLRFPSDQATTTMAAASQSLRDEAGNVYVFAGETLLQQPLASTALDAAIARGEVVEITPQEYGDVYVRMTPGMPR